MNYNLFIYASLTALVASLDPHVATAQTGIDPVLATEAEMIANAQAFELDLPKADCPEGLDKVILEAGKSYFDCDIKATTVILRGDGDTSLAMTRIEATGFVQESTGFVDLTVAKIKATAIEFESGAEVNLQGARLRATSICGDLSFADLSGSLFAATAMSANLDRANVTQATFDVGSLSSGTAKGTRFSQTVLKCRTMRFDFSESIGRPIGGCFAPTPSISEVIC